MIFNTRSPIPIATTSVIGGVKIGTGLSIDSAGVLSSNNSITIDSILNTASDNPVKNSAITVALNNKANKTEIPTNISELTNDAGYLTSYTEIDPTVPSWAKASSKPTYTFSEIDSKPTTISGYGISDAYTKTQIDNLVAGVLHYKGTKAAISNLPTSSNVIGDTWHITADGSEWAWDGTSWQELGTTIDLSNYVTTDDSRLTDARTPTAHNQALSTITGADDLKAIEALTGTSGLLKKTATNTWTLDTSNYLTSYTETDPTVPSWAKASTKPTYTASEVGAATASHTHGNITNAGDITATAAIASGDRLIINDESASKITNSSITFGNATSQYLANNGTWQNVPVIPTNVSSFNNDAGYLTSYTETDPTVPSWAKQTTKPSYTASEVGAAPSSHTHGNITNTGDITATAPTIANGDQIVINDNSASKITNGPTFDGSTTTKALTPKGTWETFSQFSGSYSDLTNTPSYIVSDIQYNATQKSIRKTRNGTVSDVITIDTLKTELDMPTKVSDLTNDAGYITDAGVTSFNGSTGAITYTAPVTSVNGATGAVTITPTIVSVTQTVTTGVDIGAITVNGTATSLKAPEEILISSTEPLEENEYVKLWIEI